MLGSHLFTENEMEGRLIFRCKAQSQAFVGAECRFDLWRPQN